MVVKFAALLQASTILLSLD